MLQHPEDCQAHLTQHWDRCFLKPLDEDLAGYEPALQMRVCTVKLKRTDTSLNKEMLIIVSKMYITIKKYSISKTTNKDT